MNKDGFLMASTNCAFCYCLTYIAEESSVLLKKRNKMYFFILNKRGAGTIKMNVI